MASFPHLIELGAALRQPAAQSGFRLTLGPLADACDRVLDDLARRGFVEGLWALRPSLWTSEPAVHARTATRLGWLHSPELMAGSLDRLEAFSRAVQRGGITDVVLLGMGGSSLAPEVMRAILGPQTGAPRFQMVDSVDPAAVEGLDVPLRTTLFLLASKSGGTIEPNSLAAHFEAQLKRAGLDPWGASFAAITDQGTSLDERAHRERFREVFINPSDIGGRYSALSYFGMVPASLMGLDVQALLSWAGGMMLASQAPPAANPGVALGTAMGVAARMGRDKLTLILSEPLEPFGLWIEQLIAESTGKQGKGVVPIAGEPRLRPDQYGDDRFFVRLRLGGASPAPGEDAREALANDVRRAGFPLVEIDVPEPAALGAEFVRWEIATATAGALLDINPFDEPNVQQAKDQTRTLLDTYMATTRIPLPASSGMLGGARASVSTAAEQRLRGRGPNQFLTLLEPGDYFGLLAYLGPDPRLFEAMRQLRDGVAERTGRATMVAYGPRYLHSTGQLHKGGPNSGVFLVVTSDPVRDLPIPGQPFSFGILELAQAIGDFQSLDATGRRAAHVHLPSPDPAHLVAVGVELLGALTEPGRTR